MRHREYAAPEALRDAIKCFWHNSRDCGTQPSHFEVMPDGYAEIIFYFGSGCSISHNGMQQALPSPFLMGLLNQPVSLTASGHLEVVGIRCYPWTVFDLLGLPSSNHGVRLFEHPITRLQPILGRRIEAGQPEQAVREVEKFFLDAHSHLAIDSMLYKAAVAMKAAHGSMPVRQVAAAAHATVRTLERKFKQSSGHTVKDVSGLMRFEQIRNRLWVAPGSNLADLAQEFGYTDQSHLSREFKRYAGTTPGAFAKQATRQQQTLACDFGAFVQS